MRKVKYAVINVVITASDVDGLSTGWNECERRFDVIIPVNTVKSIDFNKIRNELLDSSIESFENQNADTKA